MTSQASTPFEAGTFTRIYDPSVGETEQWYINDHCFALGPDGVWHMFGITHAEPLNPMDEKCLAHACSASLAQTPWRKLPFALTADREHWDEFHLWAPFIVRHEGAYYMYVCVGDEDHRTYKIHLAVSGTCTPGRGIRRIRWSLTASTRVTRACFGCGIVGSCITQPRHVGNPG